MKNVEIRTPGTADTTTAPATSATSEPVTVLVTRRVKAGRERDFERLVDRMGQEAASYPGHLGMAVVRPVEGSREYAVIFRFDSPAHLAAWRESPVRTELLKASVELAESAAVERELTGLEAWFSVPGGQVVRPPTRWKMWLLSICAVYPTITVLVLLAGPVLERLALPLRFAVVVPVLTALMTWVLMPLLSRWSARWLYR